MKRLFSILVSLPLLVAAQNNPLIVEGTSPSLYLNYNVAPKENYYSVGRLFNISPKEIAPFNKLELEKGLSLNQSIKIPLTEVNFTQQNDAAADETLVPVYYTVLEKEGLYRISVAHNKLPLETLKQWNNIKGDAVAKGTKIIVGYLKVKKDLSALSKQAKPMPATAVAKKVVEPVKPVVSNTATVPEKKVVVTATEKPIPQTTTVATPVKKDIPPVVKETPADQATTQNTGVRALNKAYFKPDFDKQTKQSSVAKEKGTAATFKSTSGWEDGKYYCLHNTATPGTIIKLTSNKTGKSVFVKVLDIMPDIKQNNDLLIRISNAAADELGENDNKFDCSLNFSK